MIKIINPKPLFRSLKHLKFEFVSCFGFRASDFKPKGFTLIELMIAAAVMVILSSITVAGFRESEKNKRLTAGQDMIINAVRNAQNRALASEAIAGSPCTINSVAERSVKSYIIFFNSTTSATLYGVDKCDNTIALETYSYPKDVVVSSGGFTINSSGVGSIQVKFIPPFGRMTASSDSAINQGSFATFT